MSLANILFSILMLGLDCFSDRTYITLEKAINFMIILLLIYASSSQFRHQTYFLYSVHD